MVPAATRLERLEDLFRHAAMQPKWRLLMAGRMWEPSALLTTIQDVPASLMKGITVMRISGMSRGEATPQMRCRQQVLI